MDKIWIVYREDQYQEECKCGEYYKVPENTFLSSWSTRDLAEAEKDKLKKLGQRRVYVYSVDFRE